MKSISRDLLVLTKNEKDLFKDFAITIRGTRDVQNIYFNVRDIEKVFNVKYRHTHDDDSIVIIKTPNGKEAYFRYPELKKQLCKAKMIKICDPTFVDSYINIIENLLFQTRLSFYESSTMDTDKSCSDIDDSERESWGERSDNTHNSEIDRYMIVAYQYKIDLLHQIIETKNKELELKDKDIEILNRELDLKDKDIEIISMQLEKKTIEASWV